jgi:hypothetical protein
LVARTRQEEANEVEHDISSAVIGLSLEKDEPLVRTMVPSLESSSMQDTTVKPSATHANSTEKTFNIFIKTSFAALPRCEMNKI